MSKDDLYHDYYKSRFTESSSRDKVWKVVCKFLQREFVGNNSAVLDLGCGYGSFINHISAIEKHAVDIGDVGGKLDSSVKFHQGDVVDLGHIPSDYFDVVFASNLLEHLTIEDGIKVMNSVNRVLKSGGRFILLQPNFKYSCKDYFDDFTHKAIYTDVGLSDLLISRGFKISKIYPKFLPFSTYSKLPTFGFLVWLYLYSPIKPFAGQMLVVGRKS